MSEETGETASLPEQNPVPEPEINKVDTNFQNSLSDLPNAKKGDSKALLLILGLIVLVVIGVAGFFLRDKFAKSVSEPTPTPAETMVEGTPAPSPTPSFNRSAYIIRVLNGTKTSGLAASVSAKLKDLGYQISKTGNATSSAITQTTVRAKVGDDNLINQLIQDLTPDYQAASGSGLKSSDDSDAEVTIGAK